MPSDLEFDFGEPDAPAGPDEPLDTGREASGRATQQIWIMLGVAVLVIALGVDLVRGHRDRPDVAPTPRSSSIPVVVPTPNLQSDLTAIALGPPSTSAIIRENVFGCPRAIGAFPPLPAQVDAVQRAFPTFMQLESSPVIDGSDGLCEIDFRARNEGGDILVVRVQAPPNRAMPMLQADDETGPGAYPYFVAADYTSATGFRIQAAVVGADPRKRVSLIQIDDLAMDSDLTW